MAFLKFGMAVSVITVKVNKAVMVKVNIQF